MAEIWGNPVTLGGRGGFDIDGLPVAKVTIINETGNNYLWAFGPRGYEYYQPPGDGRQKKLASMAGPNFLNNDRGARTGGSKSITFDVPMIESTGNVTGDTGGGFSYRYLSAFANPIGLSLYWPYGEDSLNAGDQRETDYLKITKVGGDNTIAVMNCGGSGEIFTYGYFHYATLKLFASGDFQDNHQISVAVSYWEPFSPVPDKYRWLIK